MNDRLLIVKMIAYIEQNLVESINSEEMALQSGYSLNRFRQKFFNVTGDTPSGYLRKRRLTEAAKKILSGEKIIDVALQYGYSSQDNFTTSFRSYFGVTPKELYNIDDKYKKFITKLREEFSIMEIVNLKQPPFNTTLMGCVRGASDYFDNDLSSPMLFGLTGHAFLINIHKDLCPSGPYVWKKEKFFDLLKEIGIEKKAGYEFCSETPLEKRRELEVEIKRYLNDGSLCILNFMEHQLFSGYDEKGFIFLQPWNGKASSEIPALTYGTWNQCLQKEGWVHFSVISRAAVKRDIIEIVKIALQYALELYREPGKYEIEMYKIGYGAYENWIDAVNRGLGREHGHWWNGMVWSECRHFASSFFNELSELLEEKNQKDICRDLKEIYEKIACNLSIAKEKTPEAKEKIRLLTESSKLEKEAEDGIDRLLNTI
jgi:AraC-like DNA-binding protein